MTMLILLLVVVGLGYRCTTPEDRARFLENAAVTLKDVRRIASKKHLESQPFRDALKSRSAWVFVTPALIALNVFLYVSMLRGQGALGDPETIVSWGGNFGPRTTNGEWWRLVFSMFLNTGFFQLIINMASLAQIGLILERVVGRAAFASVYFAAGIFGSLLSLSSYPVNVSAGPSAAIFGLYGLLAAVLLWGFINRRPAPDTDAEIVDEICGPLLTIPMMVVKRLAPAAFLFLLYNLFNESIGAGAELAGMLVGGVAGSVLAKGTSEAESPAPRVAATMAVVAVIALATAVPLRGIADIRPEMANIVDVETRTAKNYQTAVEQFQKGRLTAEGLAQTIDRNILPELAKTDARIKSLSHVPTEHQQFVTDAEEYLRLRTQSWLLRAEGLRRTNTVTLRKVTKTERESDESWRIRAESQYRGNMVTLGKAESAERASLSALERIKTVDVK
jgi:membrane associated rhomboid family serine protease